MVAEGAGSRKGRAEMSLPPNLAPDRAELGSASQPVKIEVGGEDLPRLAKIFAGRCGMRGLIVQIFWSRSAIWRLFYESERFTRS